MTTAALERAPSRERPPRLSGLVVACTALITTVGAVVTDVPNSVSIGVVVVVVTLFGLPHGAVDHLVAVAIAGDDPAGPGRQVRFHAWYLAVIGGYGLVWLTAPAVALAGFLLISVHHFGQSDLAYLGLPEVSQLAIQWSRGLFVVGLPLVAHLEVVSPLIAELGGGDPANWGWLADRWFAWAGVIVVQHVVIGTSIARRYGGSGVVGRELVTVTVLGSLFLVVDPLIGFAVYFGLWHSLAHLRVLAEVLDPTSRSNGGASRLGVRRLVVLVAPRTVLSAIGVGGVVGGAVVVGRADLALPAVFVLVSLLTVPHLVVVERLWRRRNARPSISRQPARHIGAGDRRLSGRPGSRCRHDRCTTPGRRRPVRPGCGHRRPRSPGSGAWG